MLVEATEPQAVHWTNPCSHYATSGCLSIAVFLPLRHSPMTPHARLPALVSNVQEQNERGRSELFRRLSPSRQRQGTKAPPPDALSRSSRTSGGCADGKISISARAATVAQGRHVVEKWDICESGPAETRKISDMLHRYLATAGVLGVLLLRRHLDFDGVACAEEPVLRACCWEPNAPILRHINDET